MAKRAMARGLTLAFMIGIFSASLLAAGDLMVEKPWARATIGQQKVGVAYMTVMNHGGKDDRLVAVATSAAKVAGLHTHLMEEGVMKMRPVEAIPVAAQGSAVLEPGGFHVMLMGLHDPLKPGDTIPMTLTFERAGQVEIDVAVLSASAKQAAAGGEHGQHGQKATAHSHDKAIALPAGPDAPTLDMAIAKDEVGGWNLEIRTTNFRFAPEKVNQHHHAGEGHAHLYVNGTKIARIYGPWFHIGSLPSGMTQVTVTLTANDHSPLAVGDVPLSLTKELHVP